MTNYQINLEFELRSQEETLLKEILGVTNTTELNENLSRFSKASLEEYIRMFIGQKVFTRGSDFKEYRLFLIIKEALNNRIPSEDTVSKLFQLTSSESRSLIRSVMSKFQYELNNAIIHSCYETIGNAEENTSSSGTLEHYSVDIKNDNILRELNRILGNINGNLPVITKKSGTYSTHIIKPSSYNALTEYFAPTPQEV